MKRIFSFLFFLFVIASVVYAEGNESEMLNVGYETYAYRHVSTIAANGARTKGKGIIMYITFVNQKSVCYKSDKNGNDLYYDQTTQTSMGQAYFAKTDKGIHIYDTLVKRVLQNPDSYSRMICQRIFWSLEVDNMIGGKGSEMEYRFKGDWSRLNIRFEKDGATSATEVWERIDSNRKSENVEFY